MLGGNREKHGTQHNFRKDVQMVKSTLEFVIVGLFQICTI